MARKITQRVASIASATPLPSELFSALLERRPELAASMCSNPFLPTDIWCRLYTPGLTGQRATALLKRLPEDPKVVEHVLVTAGEHRPSLVDELWRHWLPTARQQRIAAAHPKMNRKAADAFLTHEGVDPIAARTVAPHASPARKLAFVRNTAPRHVPIELAAQLVSSALEEGIGSGDEQPRVVRGPRARAVAARQAEQAATPGAVLELFFERPEVVEALVAGDPASWHPFLAQTVAGAAPVANADRLVQWATNREHVGSSNWFSTVADLLDHPSVAPPLRRELWKLVEQEGHTPVFLGQHVAGPDSPLHDGKPLGSIRDPKRIEQLTLRTSLRTWGFNRFQQWAELAANPHLSPQNATRVFWRLDALSISYTRFPAYDQAVERLRARCPELDELTDGRARRTRGWPDEPVRIPRKPKLVSAPQRPRRPEPYGDLAGEDLGWMAEHDLAELTCWFLERFSAHRAQAFDMLVLMFDDFDGTFLDFANMVADVLDVEK